MRDPEKIGKYEVEGVLGEGGFGIVYRARDPVIDRHVAIKVCSRPNDELRKRFRREAKIAGRLQHRHIVVVHDFGFHDDVPYLVQELLPGEDLASWIKQQAELPPLAALDFELEILCQIAEGLAYAHGQGVIHRDIKPANVRLLPSGEIKILDFGIAKLLSAEIDLTREDMMVGTGPYLSPEMWQGHEVDLRADIFSFGVLAYELLARRRPFTADTTQALFYRILRESPLPLQESAPHCPETLARLVHRCLEKDVEQRWAKMSTLVPELRALQHGGRPVPAASSPAARNEPGLASLVQAALDDSETDSEAGTKNDSPSTSMSSTLTWQGKAAPDVLETPEESDVPARPEKSGIAATGQRRQPLVGKEETHPKTPSLQRRQPLVGKEETHPKTPSPQRRQPLVGNEESHPKTPSPQRRQPLLLIAASAFALLALLLIWQPWHTPDLELATPSPQPDSSGTSIPPSADLVDPEPIAPARALVTRIEDAFEGSYRLELELLGSESNVVGLGAVMRFSASIQQPGYLLMFFVDSEGHITLVYPGPGNKGLALPVGVVELPRPEDGVRLQATVAGRDTLVVAVSPQWLEVPGGTDLDIVTHFPTITGEANPADGFVTWLETTVSGQAAAWAVGYQVIDIQP